MGPLKLLLPMRRFEDEHGDYQQGDEETFIKVLAMCQAQY